MTVSLGQILQENQYRLGPQRKMIHFATDPIFTDPHLVNNTSNDLCPGLGLHGVEIFDSNKYRQRDRTCLPNTDTHRIRDATD